jgi:hypothetical protein
MLGKMKKAAVRRTWVGPFLAMSFLLPISVGCGGSAQVRSEQLPVRRVVVYRNGVA